MKGWREWLWAVISLIILGALLAGAMHIQSRMDDCEDKGGVLVQKAPFGWACVD